MKVHSHADNTILKNMDIPDYYLILNLTHVQTKRSQSTQEMFNYITKSFKNAILNGNISEE